MAVKLAQTAGFCMGVKRAVDLVLEVAQRKGNETVYTYGPLIHNPQTVELLRKRGIIPIASLDELAGKDKGSMVIIRAHGISPQERRRLKETGLRIVDATCPRVGLVQGIIKKHAREGYHILIVGDEAHPEVNGLLGYAEGRGILLSSPADVAAIPELDKVCVVAQTTQNPEEYRAVCEAVQGRFPHAVVFNTICDSTEKRQGEVEALAREMDAMIIVGGRNSANTKRLADLARRRGIPVAHIETPEELDPAALQAWDRVGVSAGASTPNWIIDRVVDEVTAAQRERGGRATGIYRLWATAVRTDLYSSVGAACLAYTASLLQGLPNRPSALAMAALYVWAIHVINRVINRRAGTVLGTFREISYQRHEKAYLTAAALSLVAALALALWEGHRPFLLLFFMSLLGGLYNAPLLPGRGRFRSLKDLPGSKNISMALAWGTVTALIPPLSVPSPFTPATAVAFAFVFGLVFIRSVLSDILDIQGDRFMGRETIPVLIGEARARLLLKGVTAVVALITAASYWAGWAPSLSLPLTLTPFYMWICFRLYDREAGFSGLVMEGVLETVYLVSGAISALWAVGRILFP